MLEADGMPRVESGEPAPAPTPEVVADRSVRQRVADRWNSLGAAKRAVVIGGVAVALVGGAFALSNRREQEPDHEDISGLAEVTNLLSLVAAEHDLTVLPADPKYVKGSWDSSPYQRSTCLNPHLHPDGCVHDLRPVAGSTKNRKLLIAAS